LDTLLHRSRIKVNLAFMRILFTKGVFLAAVGLAFRLSLGIVGGQNKEWSIGLVLVQEQSGTVYVQSVLPGTPASNQGEIRPGDVLIAVSPSGNNSDFRLIQGLSLQEISGLIMGAAETDVALQLRRAGKLLVVILPRGSGTLPSAEIGRHPIESITPPISSITVEGIEPISGKGPSEVRYPAFSAWERITNGMSAETVVRLLGKPLKTLYLNSETTAWIYGWIEFQSPLFPAPFTFEVHLKDDIVRNKLAPFDQVLKEEGSPSVPKLLLPANNHHFTHFPRFLDIRWLPSSGFYPIEYVVQVEAFSASRWITREIRTDIPYVCLDFYGETRGRWRVLATNEFGASHWSEFRYFEFTTGTKP
jgi:hypothetical protein